MKRVPIAVFATLLVLTGCANSVRGEATDAAAVSRSAAAEERRLEENAAASASSSAAAASSSAAAAAAEASASAAAEAARKVPTVFTGSGDSVVAISKPGGGDGTVIATITGNDARRHFAVQGLDGDQDLLVNTTDPYSGSVLMDAELGGTTQLQVSASGPWSITLSDPLTAPELKTGANSGSGDQVFIWRGRAGIAQIDGNAGARHFGVIALTGTGNKLLVNTTDPYSGSVPMPAGPGFLTVSADSDWSITIS